MKNPLKVAAWLIAGYLLVKNAPAVGVIATKGAAGGRDIIKTFQGR